MGSAELRVFAGDGYSLTLIDFMNLRLIKLQVSHPSCEHGEVSMKSEYSVTKNNGQLTALVKGHTWGVKCKLNSVVKSDKEHALNGYDTWKFYRVSIVSSIMRNQSIGFLQANG